MGSTQSTWGSTQKKPSEEASCSSPPSSPSPALPSRLQLLATMATMPWQGEDTPGLPQLLLLPPRTLQSLPSPLHSSLPCSSQSSRPGRHSCQRGALHSVCTDQRGLCQGSQGRLERTSGRQGCSHRSSPPTCRSRGRLESPRRPCRFH